MHVRLGASGARAGEAQDSGGQSPLCIIYGEATERECRVLVPNAWLRVRNLNHGDCLANVLPSSIGDNIGLISRRYSITKIVLPARI